MRVLRPWGNAEQSVGFSAIWKAAHPKLRTEAGPRCRQPQEAVVKGYGMEFFNGLSDDQKAIIGGLVALFASGGLMSASYYLGRSLRRGQDSLDQPAPQIVPLSRAESERPPIRKAA